MQQPDSTLKRQYISDAILHDLFYVISQEIGFTEDEIDSYEDDFLDLIEIWQEQGFIEVYVHDYDRRFGRIKDMASVRGSVPYYLDMFHARVLSNDNDPLLVITFKDTDATTEDGKPIKIAVIRFMAIHDDLFGEENPKVKFNPQKMRAIRKRIDDLRKRGDLYDQKKDQH